MSSDSSDDDLPPPSVLLDKLLTPSTPLKPTRSTLSKSINKPVSNPPLPLSESATPYKDTTRQQRRSSPRLLEKRVCQSQTSSSISPPPPPLPLPIQRALSPLVLEDQDLSRESERERHDSLVMELFPPSPPPPQTHSSTSNRPRSQSVVSDSEAESRGIGMRRKEQGKCGCEGEKNLRRTSEGTVVSDSEAENNQSLRNFEKENRNKKTPRKPRSSISFTIDSSSSSDEDEREGDRSPMKKKEQGVHAKSPQVYGKKMDQDDLVNSLNRLEFTSSTPPKPSSSPFPASRPRVPSPARSPTSPSISRTDPSTPRPPERTARTPHQRRRITISIASSSDSSDSDSPIVKRGKTPRSRAKKDEENEEEVIVVETDDDDEVLLPIASDPELGLNGNARRDGGFGYKGMQDVWENDGVLIYEPTPKKRPTKLTLPTKLTETKPSPSPSPFIRPPLPSSSSVPLDTPTTSKKSVLKKNNDRRSEPLDSPTKGGGTGTSKRRVEIDLTGSSSEEEDDLSPPARTSIHSRSFPSTPTNKKPSAPTPRRSPSKPKPKPTPSSRSSAPLLTPSDRSQLPLDLIRELDKLVFRKKWEGLTCLGDGGGKGLPDGLEVVWNNRLLKTAGRAKWKSIKSPGKETVHKTTIELATKVTDTEEKLKHTLAHELCHIAAWILSNEVKPPHGNAFKLWAKRIMLVRKDIEVTTTHSYQIVYKYRWQCSSSFCGKIFGRHSNSINPSTHGCPCGGKLSGIDKDGNLKKEREKVMVEGEDGKMVETPKKKSPWLEFVATESPIVRKEISGIPQSEVLKVVAERWKVKKEEMARSAMREKEEQREKERKEEGELQEAFEVLKV